MLSRRGLLFGLGATLFIAPAIVHSSNLMKINSALMPRGRRYVMDYDEIHRVGFYKDRQTGVLLNKWGDPQVFYEPMQGDPLPDYYEAVDAKYGVDWDQPNWSVVKSGLTKDEYMAPNWFHSWCERVDHSYKKVAQNG